LKKNSLKKKFEIEAEVMKKQRKIDDDRTLHKFKNRKFDL